MPAFGGEGGLCNKYFLCRAKRHKKYVAALLFTRGSLIFTSSYMERKVPFVEGEFYHVYTRGVDNRTIFTCAADYERFIALLVLSNTEGKVHLRNLCAKYEGESLVELLEHVRPSHARTDVLAYALMPDSLHLILKEKRRGGISAFMHTLMTSYAMYFNFQNARSGPLFCHPFRSRHVDDDAYFRWLFAYVHLALLEVSRARLGKSADRSESGERMHAHVSLFELPRFLFWRAPSIEDTQQIRAADQRTRILYS